MSTAPKIHALPDEAESRLAALGFPGIQVWQDALLEAFTARATCTKLDPPPFKGFTFSSVTTRSLRRQLLPIGFTMSNKGGPSRTLTADGTRAIIVATGTRGTGKSEGNPQTKSAKGPLVLRAIAVNDAIQLSLPGLLPVEPAKEREPELWMFLVRVVPTKKGNFRLYSEVSCPSVPSGKDLRRRIVSFHERIVIPSLLTDDGDALRDEEPESGPQIDVDVTRRQA